MKSTKVTRAAKVISIIFSLLLLLLSSGAFAGTTGKIAGKVTDKKTGEPLPGVNIIISGTTMGSATDIKGNYFIININFYSRISYYIRLRYIYSTITNTKISINHNRNFYNIIIKCSI